MRKSIGKKSLSPVDELCDLEATCFETLRLGLRRILGDSRDRRDDLPYS